MTGKGYVLAVLVPKQVKGMAYRFRWHRGYSKLQARVQFYQPDVDFLDLWVELADIPRNLLGGFLHAYYA